MRFIEEIRIPIAQLKSSDLYLLKYSNLLKYSMFCIFLINIWFPTFSSVVSRNGMSKRVYAFSHISSTGPTFL
jgi:hypothetical protein